MGPTAVPAVVRAPDARAFTILGKKTGTYETVVTRDIAIWQVGKLQEFDAIVMLEGRQLRLGRHGRSRWRKGRIVLSKS